MDITITGAGFEENASIYIGGMLAANIQYVSSSALVASTPTALPEGVHDITVQNPDGSSASLALAFSVIADAKTSCAILSTKGTWPIFLIALMGLARRRKQP